MTVSDIAVSVQPQCIKAVYNIRGFTTHGTTMFERMFGLINCHRFIIHLYTNIIQQDTDQVKASGGCTVLYIKTVACSYLT